MYYWLTKPGIVFSNTLAAMAGFFLASSLREQLALNVLLGLVVGIALVIASACVLNNYIDRDIDRTMKRTKKRPTATGKISTKATIIYTAGLAAAGFGVLYLATNLLVVALGAFAYVAYIVLYGVAKRATIHSTLVGTISGAVPPVAGYVAVTHALDMATLLLFLIMVTWQMAHFYAIAIRRQDEYKKAHLPLMSVVKGSRITKIQILVYIAAFSIFNELLVAYRYVHYTYLIVMSILAAIWFIRGIQGFDVDEDKVWARKMFLFSLIVLISFFGMTSIGAFLP